MGGPAALLPASGNQQTYNLQSGWIYRTCWIDWFLFVLDTILEAFLDLGGRLQFGGHLVQGCAQEGLSVSQGWFFSCNWKLESPPMTFRWPIGTTLESLVHVWHEWWHQKACLDCRRDSSRCLIRIVIDFWCPCRSTVNEIVFIRCLLSDFLLSWMTLASNSDQILVTLEGLGAPIWWFVGLLYRHWNFNEFQGVTRDTPSWGTGPGWW